MHPLLKFAYQQGIERSVDACTSLEERGWVKEALDWSRAATLFNPFKNVAKSVASAALPAGRGVTAAGQKAALSGLGSRALAQHATRTGVGAGIGAIAGGEGERGRGAMVGALAGLGMSAGARLGGAAARRKMLAGIGGKAARFAQQGKIAPNAAAIEQFVRQQATKGTWKHLNARQLMGSAALGTGGAVGTGMAANALIPRTPPPQNPYAQLFQQASGFGAARPRYYQAPYSFSQYRR